MINSPPTMRAVPSFSANRFLHILLAAYALVWISAAIVPRDRPTWALENLSVVIFIGILALTYRRFTFSNPSYLLIAIFLSLHAVGAHSGYAETPIGYWLKETLGLHRNPYDRVIHFSFGLLLAYPMREVLVRAGEIRGWAANWLPVSLVLTTSVCFEIIGAVVAEMISPGSGPAWLGAQGDEWDAQLDMAVALLGALAAMLITWWRERAAASPRPAAINEKPFRERRLLQTLCICYGIIWICAAIQPLNPNDWLLENLLVFVSVPLLVLTYHRLSFSDAFYVLVFLFLILHAAGAHFTYSEVPFGYWLKDTFHLRRNHFDRIVHFSFGLLLTYPVHEILVRVVGVRGYWALFLAVAVIASLNGFFEIIEAVVAWLVDPDLGAAYLGIQGDVWDAQKDMALAVLGAALTVGLALLTRTSWSGRPSRR